jgi:hypothetical protein
VLFLLEGGSLVSLLEEGVREVITKKIFQFSTSSVLPLREEDFTATQSS